MSPPVKIALNAGLLIIMVVGGLTQLTPSPQPVEEEYVTEVTTVAGDEGVDYQVVEKEEQKVEDYSPVEEMSMFDMENDMMQEALSDIENADEDAKENDKEAEGVEEEEEGVKEEEEGVEEEEEGVEEEEDDREEKEDLVDEVVKDAKMNWHKMDGDNVPFAPSQDKQKRPDNTKAEVKTAGGKQENIESKTSLLGHVMSSWAGQLTNQNARIHKPPSQQVAPPVIVLTGDDFLDIQTGKMDPSDPLLIHHIRDHIVYPSAKLYNLTEPYVQDPSQAGQASIVDKLLNYKKGGFFLEVGAANGEKHSNTLYLERFRNWNGLLIEAHPEAYQSLLYKRRKAYSLNACVSPNNLSSQEVFRMTTASSSMSGLKGYVDDLHSGHDFSKLYSYDKDVKVQCYPLWSILQAISRSKIDYLSLDVEGSELDILKTLPFDRLDITIITVEYQTKGSEDTESDRSIQKLEDIRKFMLGTGRYEELGILTEGSVKDDRAREGLDVVFRKITQG